ncbi:unnamed protein product [Didymodactylos carnosus]|uniref:Uncharacterized protein n=1 Tax=Didymodactylos carnosus TaxID=1234261 RepID=A0A814XLN9_9BILA|nr:unnamed protein product [Didymodactylos carnosus]CAF3982116.1 unnamed protein product [Didymodactylos carnosus]
MKEGQRLTPDGFKALSKIIDNQSILNEEILPVLVTISNSKRVIPDYLIEKLVVRFNPKRVHSQLIKILENELLLKLEQALENKLISDQVLLIFVFQGQKREKLSRNIIIKIVDKFLTIENQLIMQQYLSVISSVIQKKDIFEYEYSTRIRDRLSSTSSVLVSHVQKALIYALEKGNQDIVSKSGSEFRTLISLHKVKLEKDSIRALLNLTTSAIFCDENLK